MVSRRGRELRTLLTVLMGLKVSGEETEQMKMGCDTDSTS